MEKAYFKGIRREIINELQKAEIQIRIAVAWFTNFELFDFICSKLEDGLKIELIIINDDINNRPAGINFQKFIDNGGILYLNSDEHLMHNKFCIIDDKVLINGSYNWTYYAENRNFENIVIHYQNKELITDFNNQFDEITSLMEKSNTFIQTKKINVLSSTNIDYVIKDCLIQCEETQNKILLDKISELRSKLFEKISRDLNKPKTLRRSIGIGVKDNKYIIVIPKNSKLPIKKSTSPVTSSDNQISCLISIFYGEKNIVPLSILPPKSHISNFHDEKNIDSENTFIGGLYLENLQVKPQGQVVFLITMELNENGILKVKTVENGTSNSAETELDINYLID